MNISFDQYCEKKGESPAVASARKTYDAALAEVQKLKGSKDEEKIETARDKKLAAGNALHLARQKAEADYYAEPVKEMTDQAEAMKSAAEKKTKTGK